MRIILRLMGLCISVSTVAFAAGAAPVVTPQLLQKGKAAFSENCASCHGQTGEGDGPAAAYLNPKPRIFSTGKFKAGSEPSEIFKTITAGLPGSAMPSFSQLKEEDRWALAYYVHSFVKIRK